MDHKPVYIFLPSHLYIEDFKKELTKATKRIYLQSMVVEFSKETTDITDVMIEKAQSGVDVQLHIDYFTKMMTYTEVLSPRARERYITKQKEMLAIVNQLISHNCNITYINKPKKPTYQMFPRLGRNHMKLTIIDDTIYIGGVSTAKRFFGYADFMIKTTYPPLVKEVSEEFFKVNVNRLTKDRAIPIDQETTLLLDSGKPGESVIFTKAIEMVNSAKKKIQYISQYIPDFELLEALNKAKKRGVEVKLITYLPKLKPDKHTENKIEHLLFASASKGLKLSYYSKSYVHAKLMIIDEKIAIFGSHNYSKFGVLFGTDEIALQTENKDLLSSLIIWYKEIASNCIEK